MNKLSTLLALSFLLAACGKATESGMADTSAASRLAAASSGTEPGPVAGGQPAPQQTAVQAGVQVANEIRRGNGLGELTLDPILTAVAQAHAEDMLRRHYFSHETPEGKTPFQRMQDAGLRYRAAAENIAMGTNDARHAFDMWLGSPGHRHNLLNKIYGRHGLGFAGGYWVHDFAD